MYPTTRDFVAALDAAGELRTIRERVSPVLEIAAIADAASKSRAPNLPSQSARRNDPRFHDRGGQALLFTNVEGSDVPVLINAYGSYRRMEMALGVARHSEPGFGGVARLSEPGFGGGGEGGSRRSPPASPNSSRRGRRAPSPRPSPW